MVLGFRSGPLIEEDVRHAILVSDGNAAVVLEQPLSFALRAATGALRPVIAVPEIRRTRSSVLVQR
ncbi:hypothetical protein Rmf_04220 [Roseomonas fluvialis]|uniref:Uncharacterized protein n=2 Tax=Roseomonas fluvialis TaxID=1750527 RepID=A0ABM7XYC4_9PROT|nr:hypothetical protein Rmf_04220 [Roseomonas fluvialis]